MAEEPDLPAPKPAQESERPRMRRLDDAKQPELPPDVSIEPVRTSNWTRLIAIILVLLFFLAIAVAAYWLYNHKHTGSTGSGQPGQTSSQNHNAAPAAGKAKVSAATKEYSSPNQNLSFEYPADWKVSETATVITAVSPGMNLTDSSGQTVYGQVIFSIRQKDQSLPEFDGGNAVAVLESQRIAYSRPTQAQRAKTYMSFAHYANSPPASLDAVYITGDFGYQVGQSIPKTDMSKLDPLVSVTFRKCTGNNCSGGTQMGIAPDLWQDKNFSDPLVTMLKSLSVS